MKIGAEARRNYIENHKTDDEVSSEETPRRLSIQSHNVRKFQKLEDLASNKVRIPIKKDG